MKRTEQILYKYRGGDEVVFNRDLKALKENYFYAPSYDQLNDPCEALVNIDRLNFQTRFIVSRFGGTKKDINEITSVNNSMIEIREEIGIYSMSESPVSELLWAHYGDGHKGFCLGYKTDKLIGDFSLEKRRLLPVQYSKSLPRFSIAMIGNDEKIKIKLIGTKSKLWSYENEVRLISKVGKNYYEPDSLKSVYFGLRMPESQKKQIMETLKGRKIQYFQIVQEEKGFRFFSKPLTVF